MKKFRAVLGFLICIQLPASASVIYTFSAGSGSSAIGFSAILPNFLNIEAGTFILLPGNTLSSCSIGIPTGPGYPDFCAGVSIGRTATAGSIEIEVASIFEPEITVPADPPAQFQGVTFAQEGSFTGLITATTPNIPASLTIQAVPEPGTSLYGGLAVLCLAMLRLRSARQRS